MKSILLIGGSSSVGKTHLARLLSEKFGVQHFCVDDLRKKINDPNLHLLDETESVWDLPAIELLARLFQEGSALEAPLYAVVDSWLVTRKTNILEGEGVVPKLASRFTITNPVQAIFIVETNQHQLYQTLYQRSSAFQNLTEPRRQRVAEMNSLYGQWLLSEAEQYRLPWVPSQPWSSLPDRVLEKTSL